MRKKVRTNNYFEKEYGKSSPLDFCKTGINGIANPWRKDFVNYVEDGQSFLDVGCGSGADWEVLRAFGKKVEYKGIDYAPSILAGAAKVCPGATFAVGDVNNLPEEDNSWDIVNCRHVINHCRYYRQPMGELLRVSKKRVIITLHFPFSNNNKDVIAPFPPYSWENTYGRGDFLTFIGGLGVKIITFNESHKGCNEVFIVLDK